MAEDISTRLLAISLLIMPLTLPNLKICLLLNKTAEQVICLPVYPDSDKKIVNYICKIISN
jgi:hypothetical protein